MRAFGRLLFVKMTARTRSEDGFNIQEIAVSRIHPDTGGVAALGMTWTGSPEGGTSHCENLSSRCV